MTDKEKELAHLLIDNYNFDKDEFIALGLLCNSEKKAKLMIDYILRNPNADFDSLLSKAIELDKNSD